MTDTGPSTDNYRTMKIHIENLEIDVDQVTVNDGLNFGRFDSVDPDRIAVYRLTIGQADFIARFTDVYNQVMTEIKADDLATGDVSEFAELGYCPLKEGFAKPDLLAVVVRDYLARDYILTDIFGGAQEAKWIINSIDSLEAGAEIILAGRCFRGASG